MDLVRGPLKAGAAALFAVGLVLLFLNPPSLSGAEGMAVFIGGGLILMLLTAWATVALTGSDSMPEDEFERLVRRSEELAAAPGLRAETSDFDLLVADAIDDLPVEFQHLLDGTPVVVCRTGSEDRAYGHYFGDTVARATTPTASCSTRTPSSATRRDPELLRAQVERTLGTGGAHSAGTSLQYATSGLGSAAWA